MSLKEDLEEQVKNIFKTTWTTRNGQVVPADNSIKFLNDAVILDATVLYADLDASTNLVDSYKPKFAAEIYKTFLYCSAKIIRDCGGEITAYDGDRIMAVFLGGVKNTQAAKAGLKINGAVKKIINPSLTKYYPNDSYVVKHVVGIDTSEIHVAKTGIRGSNDLVWVGRAANYAAKLCCLPSDYPTWITHTVYNSLANEAKYGKDNKNMWEAISWTSMNNFSIYRSSWWWGL
ncbi:MAG: adenylate/guanylate cyclase domain-containing protein [Vampirovibrionales bacterium]|nr:adenylate/guanylate cyclase domain-containing protein [Vampirovibrionales bacterium]